MTRLAPRTIISCPHCQHLASKTSVTSFNTGDLTRWSDGYAASWFGQPFFTRCTACHGVYWVEDASVVSENQSPDTEYHRPRSGWLDRIFGGNQRKVEASTLSDDLFGPRSITSPDIDAIVIGVEAAASGSKEREQLIRRRLWWSFNDRYRRSTPAVQTISRAIQQAHEDSNLERLLELSYDDGQPTLETGEVLREQGRFDEARQALVVLSPGTLGYDALARKLDERDSKVCVLQEADWHPSQG